MIDPDSAGALDHEAIGVREARLTRTLRRARDRGTTERWLYAAGGGLAVAGLAVIIAGWAGTSHTVLVAGQIPYVVSGGLLGLALVVLGGFLYFGYWLSAVVRSVEGLREDLRQRDRQMFDPVDEVRT